LAQLFSFPETHLFSGQNINTSNKNKNISTTNEVFSHTFLVGRPSDNAWVSSHFYFIAFITVTKNRSIFANNKNFIWKKMCLDMMEVE